MRALYLLPLLALGCAPQPMTLERADRLCRKEAPLADGVRTDVAVGVGTGGARAKTRLTVTNRIFNPQTEREFLAECIARRMAGRPPPTTAGIVIERSTR